MVLIDLMVVSSRNNCLSIFLEIGDRVLKLTIEFVLFIFVYCVVVVHARNMTSQI